MAAMAPITEMKDKEMRAAILRQWFALPPTERATKQQAASFVDETIQTYGILADNDAHLMVRKLLGRYTGLAPIF
jgi:hypothetical protein